MAKLNGVQVIDMVDGVVTKIAYEGEEYAKVVDDSNIYNAGSIRADEIVEIIKDDKSGVPYYIKSVTSGATVWANSSHIVKATDEEVAEAKRKLAEEKEAKKWAEIGRKPNEFKKGDIVRVLKYGVRDYDSSHNHGDIGIVEDGDGTDRPLVNVADTKQFSVVELITPVERRFDR